MTAGYTGALPAGRAYAPIRDTVASPRLDAVVKALIGTSREEAARLIAAGLVSLNHLPSLSASAPVREGTACPCGVKAATWWMLLARRPARAGSRCRQENVYKNSSQ